MEKHELIKAYIGEDQLERAWKRQIPCPEVYIAEKISSYNNPGPRSVIVNATNLVQGSLDLGLESPVEIQITDEGNILRQLKTTYILSCFEKDPNPSSDSDDLPIIRIDLLSSLLKKKEYLYNVNKNLWYGILIIDNYEEYIFHEIMQHKFKDQYSGKLFSATGIGVNLLTLMVSLYTKQFTSNEGLIMATSDMLAFYGLHKVTNKKAKLGRKIKREFQPTANSLAHRYPVIETYAD